MELANLQPATHTLELHAPGAIIPTNIYAPLGGSLRGTMLWVAALLSLIIWVIGWQSGFLGWLIHLFLLLAILAALAALLPRRSSE